MTVTDSISIVMPTYNRAEALRSTLPGLLEVEGIAEIIIVDDASSDDTARVLAQARDPRLRVLRHATRQGVAAARNTGVDASSGLWVLFGEDDCILPKDYASTLRREAELHSADLVSAPWLNVPLDRRAHALREGRARAVAKIGLDSHPSTFPLAAIETPFLTARALIHTSVFENVRFFEGFRGNAYREETDFFVSAARRGYRCMVTPATACYQAAHWAGGCGSQGTRRVWYEYWACRNNRLFLQRHGAWLREHGHIRSQSRSQLQFVSGRIRSRAQPRLRRLLEVST
jgi:GT2 family glycosyltransferase